MPVWVVIGGVGVDVDLLDVESAVGREEQLVLVRCRRILGTDVIDVVARHLWGGVGRGMVGMRWGRVWAGCDE